MNALLDLVGDVGYALDTPGAYLRGALAGRPGRRASGEDLLSSYGVDGGPVGGFLAETLLDPTDLLLGGGLAAGGAAVAQKLRDGSTLSRRLAGLGRDTAGGMTRGDLGLGPNPLADRLREFMADEEGALRPFELIGRRSDPDVVNAKTWYHGSATPGLTPQSLDPMETDPSGLFGRGIYMSDEGDALAGKADKLVTAEYADARMPGEQSFLDFEDMAPERALSPSPRIYEAGTDFGRILDMDLMSSADPESAELLMETLRRMDPGGRHVARAVARLGRQGADRTPLVHTFNDLLRARGMGAPDPLIRALREEGVDALTHSGGLLSGGGDYLHQALIGLDPNDAISGVGRAGQVTRFDEFTPEQALARILARRG